MRTLYPLRLTPVSKDILWGGRRLIEQYRKSAVGQRLAESWELTVRADEMNTIANGPAAGMGLDAYIREQGFAAVSPEYDGGRFPLLIKFIDAADRLSIQVHPDDAYGLAHEGELGKTEMWYIVDAEPGAQLVYGLRDGVTKEDFAAAVKVGRIGDTLRYVDVRPGEVYFIPSGHIHAIGAGILIAEIQQNSNVTYRVYDYDRRQADGSLRPLHTEKALDVIRLRTDAEIGALRFAAASGEPSEIAACAYFRVRKIVGNATLRADVRFISLLCLSGSGEIQHNGIAYSIRPGDSYFLPAGLGACTIIGDATLLASETV